MKRLTILLPSVAIGLCLVLVLMSRIGPASRAAAQPGAEGLTQAQIIEALKKASTGNLADAIETATGRAGFMTHDMKPIFRAKVVGPAATALLRPILTTDKRKYPNYHLQVLDEAPAGSVLVYVLENGLHVSGIGNLMATTATVRGLAGAVIDGAARDIEEIERIGFPVYSRAVSPATVVGRYVSVSMQEPVICAGVPVRPGDYIVGDSDGVVVVPSDRAEDVLALIREYDEKESAMIPLIKETKSMLKALAKYGRY